MKIRILPLSLTLIAVATLAGCSATSCQHKGDHAKHHAMHHGQHGKADMINVGESLTITLPSNITTGYSWSVAEINNNFLVLAQEPSYQGGNSNDGKVGQPGEQTFVFQGIASGTTSLKLVYQRPFDTDTAPAKTHERTVTIK